MTPAASGAVEISGRQATFAFTKQIRCEFNRMRDDLRANRVRYFANLCDVLDIAGLEGSPRSRRRRRVTRWNAWMCGGDAVRELDAKRQLVPRAPRRAQCSGLYACRVSVRSCTTRLHAGSRRHARSLIV